MTDASHFNAWHGDVADSPEVARIFSRALGLPPGFVSNSLLSWSGIAEVTAALRLSPGQTLVDLACGRGGYSREVADRTGARLAGFDFSEVAVKIASGAVLSGAVLSGAVLSGAARFCVGDYMAVGLRDGCADAVMCIDAIQFGEPPLAGVTEARRILVPGGRVVFTAWEPVNPGGPFDERLPERSRRMHLGRDLAAAGFENIVVTVKPDWYAAERAFWETALAADPAGDPALISLQKEGTRSLTTHDSKRRVLATATTPR